MTLFEWSQFMRGLCRKGAQAQMAAGARCSTRLENSLVQCELFVGHWGDHRWWGEGYTWTENGYREREVAPETPLWQIEGT